MPFPKARDASWGCSLRSISCRQIAEEVFAQCLAGTPPKELPAPLLEGPCAQALFTIVVEGLADRFEPALCDVYARVFARVVAQLDPTSDAMSLVARYERVRRPRPVTLKPHHVFVLSRVTLGADVAVTSVLMAAAKRRFPHAEIAFIGPRKNYELFAGDPRIHHLPLDYPRGGLRERLAAGSQLKQLVGRPASIVIDPDSRFTQLGILPVSSEENYFLFESRAYGGETDRSLPELAAAWAKETFGVDGAKPYIALGRSPRKGAHTAISFGVGENPAKRIPDPFEEELLKALASRGHRLCVDSGAGGAEAQRVAAAVKRAGVDAIVWQGSFAGFASIIATSRLYVGYDSAGQHVAAACGVPLVSIFAGFPAPRMFARWSPRGAGCTVIKVDRRDPEEILARVVTALGSFSAKA